jgi:hypothetical protein
MFLHVKEAKYVAEYKIWLKFNDEKEGIVNLENELYGEVFTPLKNLENFKTFKVGEVSETIEWPNFQVDIAPEFLRDKMI